MKKIESILGLPVVDISTGEQTGKVKDVLVNSEKGSLDFVVIGVETENLITKVISALDIIGIGEYALTIQTSSVIRELNKTSEAINLMQSNIKVKNTRVMTRKGSLIGLTGDIYVDEDNKCQITGIEFKTDEGMPIIGILPAECVITYGKNLIIVDDDSEQQLTDSIEGIEIAVKPDTVMEKAYDQTGIYEETEAVENTSDGEGFQDTYGDDQSAATLEEDYGQESDKEDESLEEEGDNSSTSAADLFEQRQRQYLVGRKASKTISDNSGEVIVREGMIINNEIIDEAKSKGKLVELVMNNRA